MAKAKKKRIKKTKKKTKVMSHTQKRLISAALCLLSLLIIISLLMGYDSLSTDIQVLAENGNIFSWFDSSEIQTDNPIGIFGVLVGYFFSYIFGYWFSLFSFIIILLTSFQYFVEPSLKGSRQKAYLLMISLFFVQALLSAKLTAYTQSVLPLALYRVLEAIFRELGARIILIGSIVLSVVLVIGLPRIKTWLSKAWGDLCHPKAEKITVSNRDKPSISKAEARQSMPNISDHVGQEQPVSSTAKPIVPKETPASKPRELDPDDDRPYQMPSVEEFLESPEMLSEKDRKEIQKQILSISSTLMDKLAEFNIEAEVRNVNIGPIITQYELEPARGVKVSKFASLADDLALAIKAKSIRVQAPIPGRGLIGIEIPNLSRDMIYLKDLLLCEDMQKAESKLAFGLGKDISGRPIVADLGKMPHLLIAGATGSGKSVCINTIIMSMILRTTPDDLRLILIDPKRVELAGYNELPHLIGEVVTDPDTALETMHWAVKEMERRYELLQKAKVREIVSYNEKAAADEEMEHLPYIVIIADEFADLIMTSGKEIELLITRLAQMARAVGMHLILATQRPASKVITGMIKANFSARIAFQVSSRVDSHVILDSNGAERLLGRGDMLFLPPGKATSIRIHGAYVSDQEIARVTEFLACQPKPKQDFTLQEDLQKKRDGFFDWDDELFPEAAKVVFRSNTASVSMLQRHFRIGYARAGRLVDLLEKAGIVGPHVGSRSRDVTASREDLILLGVLHEED